MLRVRRSGHARHRGMGDLGSRNRGVFGVVKAQGGERGSQGSHSEGPGPLGEGLGDIRRAGRALEVFRAGLRAWRRALAFWLLS